MLLGALSWVIRHPAPGGLRLSAAGLAFLCTGTRMPPAVLGDCVSPCRSPRSLCGVRELQIDVNKARSDCEHVIVEHISRSEQHQDDVGLLGVGHVSSSQGGNSSQRRQGPRPWIGLGTPKQREPLEPTAFVQSPSTSHWCSRPWAKKPGTSPVLPSLPALCARGPAHIDITRRSHGLSRPCRDDTAEPQPPVRRAHQGGGTRAECLALPCGARV